MREKSRFGGFDGRDTLRVTFPERISMPRYRLLAIDIDGTLVNSDNVLTEQTRTALLRRGAGVEIVLATGRRYSRALPLVEPLALNVPLITASGALIKQASDHQTLYRAEFGDGALEQTLAAIAAGGYDAVLYADTFDQGFDYFCASITPLRTEMLEFLERNAGCERIHPELMSQPPAGIFSGFAMGTRDEMIELQDEPRSATAAHSYRCTCLRSPRYSGFMCEIAPANVSKWTGLDRLASAWGIRAEEICAAGDDVNDIPMIKAAGLGVAMGNALDVVKAAGRPRGTQPRRRRAGAGRGLDFGVK